MSKPNQSRKKVVVTTQPSKSNPNQNRTPRRRPAGSRQQPTSEMIFGKDHYMWMGIGAVLIILGMLLMAGGGMDDPNNWDESQIYSFRRTVLAPMVILAGLGVEIYAIFKK
ncbi:MAG: DUF3098 domain-containing protein [Saprospiraceae bacterium]|nr:DUF3098 domain-containing protein [Saprospiraceae bacterium]